MAERLRQSILGLYDRHLSEDGKAVDYAALKQDPGFRCCPVASSDAGASGLMCIRPALRVLQAFREVFWYSPAGCSAKPLRVSARPCSCRACRPRTWCSHSCMQAPDGRGKWLAALYLTACTEMSLLRPKCLNATESQLYEVMMAGQGQLDSAGPGCGATSCWSCWPGEPVGCSPPAEQQVHPFHHGSRHWEHRSVDACRMST